MNRNGASIRRECANHWLGHVAQALKKKSLDDLAGRSPDDHDLVIQLYNSPIQWLHAQQEPRHTIHALAGESTSRSISTAQIAAACAVITLTFGLALRAGISRRGGARVILLEEEGGAVVAGRWMVADDHQSPPMTASRKERPIMTAALVDVVHSCPGLLTRMAACHEAFRSGDDDGGLVLDLPGGAAQLVGYKECHKEFLVASC